MLAATDLQNPLLWAVLIGWILSVVLHEFAHGFVAYLGGDYTIKERGGLTLNPLQYVDPVMSILLPAVFLMMGGVPLPGGSTFIRHDLLRGPLWKSLVSAAGPATNLLLFLLLCVLLRPAVGFVDYDKPLADWTNPQLFVAAMAFLQGVAVVLNLVPVPPLDGFGIISPFLPADLRNRLTSPPLSYVLYGGYFLLLFSGGPVTRALWTSVADAIQAMGIPAEAAWDALHYCLHGGNA